MFKSFLDKLNDIDKQAFEIAQTVLQHPDFRSLYLESLQLLRRQFSEAIKELEQNWPEIYRKVNDQLSEILLDLNFVENESNDMSLRISALVEQKKNRKHVNLQSRKFPLPPDAANVTRTLKSDMVNFQTSLSLSEIAKFFRNIFIEEWQLKEYRLFTDDYSEQFINLIFTGLPDQRKVIVQAVDLAFSSMQDLRNVNVRSEAE
jgi:hypothetical protein